MVVAPEHLTAELDYSWVPFTVGGDHLSFAQHRGAVLRQGLCSHWGPAVYKWEGLLTEGPHGGKVGILIGETSDIRARVKQYLTGTQERGNKLWRETFLAQAEAQLYTLRLSSLRVSGRSPVESSTALASANIRLVLEQLLVMKAVAEADDSRWVVNARQ